MPQTPRTVLVTDGEQRASLAVVRSLGESHMVVHVCSARTKSIAGGSKYARSERLVANPLLAPTQYVTDVLAYAREINADVVLPMTEASLLAILPERKQFANMLIPFADLDAFLHVSDKGSVLDAAQQVGITIPAQQTLHSMFDVERLQIDGLKFPLVVKPSRSVAGEGGNSGSRAKFAVQHAANADELRDIFKKIDARAFPLLLQQRVVGPGVGIFVLLWDGELIAAFSHRRIREQPPSGGVSVLRESFPMDPTLLTKSCALLDRFDWQGVAMIEYKVDEATGTPYLMEINGRFWGSLQLAVDAGVDFPLLLIEVASGEKPQPVTTYNPSVQSRWFWGDINHIIARLRHSDAALALPPGSPSRIRALVDFLRQDSDMRNEVFRLNDFRPFWRESIQWFQDLREE